MLEAQVLGKTSFGFPLTNSKASASTVSYDKLDEEPLDGVFDSLNLALELPVLVGGHAGCNDWPRDAASSAKSCLGGHEDVWDVLILAEQRQMEHNLDGLNVSGHNDEFANTSVECLCRLVGSLLELLVMRCLLDKVQDLICECGICQRECLRVCCARHDE